MEPTMKKYRTHVCAHTRMTTTVESIPVIKYESPAINTHLGGRALSLWLAFSVLREKLGELVEHQKLWRGSRNLLPD
jgi:hypothetical protein